MNQGTRDISSIPVPVEPRVGTGRKSVPLPHSAGSQERPQKGNTDFPETLKLGERRDIQRGGGQS